MCDTVPRKQVEQATHGSEQAKQQRKVQQSTPASKPHRLYKSPDRLYKAATDYTKPQKDNTKPPKDYRKTRKTIQSPRKTIETFSK